MPLSKIEVYPQGDDVQLMVEDVDSITGIPVVPYNQPVNELLQHLQVAKLIQNLEDDKASQLPLTPGLHILELGAREAGAVERELTVWDKVGPERLSLYHEKADMTQLLTDLQAVAKSLNIIH